VTQIVEMAPRTGFEMPDADQLRRLRDIVTAAHPWLRAGATDAAEFERAFWAAGTFFRVSAPVSSVYYVHWVEAACTRLELAGLPPIGGPSFLLACLAWADIQWQRPDAGVGALLELAINEHSGMKCRAAWRQVLSGERSLLPPVFRDRGIARQEGVRVMKAGEAPRI
jgi:hypothetical protein